MTPIGRFHIYRPHLCDESEEFPYTCLRANILHLLHNAPPEGQKSFLPASLLHVTQEAVASLLNLTATINPYSHEVPTLILIGHR
jgi:hypothetical protein